MSVYKYNASKTSGSTTPASSSSNPAPSTTTSTATSTTSSTPVTVPASSTQTSSSTRTSTQASSPPVSPPASASSTSSTTSPSTGSPAPSGWHYRGCYVDTVRPRTLPDTGMWYDVPMTPSACTTHCAQKGFAIAGTEYTGECYCGNAMVGGATSRPQSECNMPCRGDSSVMCGGPARLSVYSRDTRTLKREEPVAGLELVSREEKSTLKKRVTPARHSKRDLALRRSMHGRSRL